MNEQRNMMNLQELQKIYPPKRPGRVTGLIPMSFVENHLLDIKKIVKVNGLRRFYRGPRPWRGATMTHKCDAFGMFLRKA
jgi:hypothetical protein